MELQVYKNAEFGSVRTTTIGGQPYFVGKDVASILGYANTRKALIDHVDEEDKGVTKCDAIGRNQTMTAINESGLYSLILSSKMPIAKKFKRWVTSEVLPAIRKHGLYVTDDLIADPDLAIAAFTALKEEREKKEEDIIAAMDETVAVALFPVVMYRSAQLLDMERITKAAHEKGILIGWDLCHSIGSVPHDFKKVDPDFAVWCTYKHISAGPGSNAVLYINKRHFGTRPGMAGWHGNKKETQFLLDHEYTPAPDADAWLTGTPNMLSMAPIEGVVKLYNQAGIHNIREKSLRLTDYLIFLIEERLKQYGFENGTLLDHSRRGGHIALEHDEAFRISLALKEKQVIPDFREPNVIRLAPAALYTSFEDVHHIIDILEEIMQEKSYDKFSSERLLVV